VREAPKYQDAAFIRLLTRIWEHHGRPCGKLLDKVKQVDGRYKKVYEKTPTPPYQRLLESAEVSDECKAELKRRKSGQDPVALNTALSKVVEKLLKINREKADMKQASFPVRRRNRPKRLLK
jgi:hypothetical protein